MAVVCKTDFISLGGIPVPLNFWLPDINKAATPPACGAAAEVPKKLGKTGDSPGSRFKLEPRSTVVFPPSGADISGLFRRTPFTGVPPNEEKVSMIGGLTPYAGVLV